MLLVLQLLLLWTGRAAADDGGGSGGGGGGRGGVDGSAAAAARAALQLLLLGQRLGCAAIDDELNGRRPIRLLRGAQRRAARRALLDSTILEVAQLAIQRLLVGNLAGIHQLLTHQKRQRQQQQRRP